MTVRLLLAGGGGFARETLDVIEAVNRQTPGAIEIVGVVDSGPSERARDLLSQRKVDIVGSSEDWIGGKLARDYDAYVICIGSPAARRSLAEAARPLGKDAAILVHPAASVGSLTRLGPGSIVCAGAVISTNVSLGPHAHINPSATVGHDARLGAAVSVNPGAIVSGDVTIGDDVLLGAGCIVLQGLRVGDRAIVGAGACVTKDVSSDSTVKGIPAR